MSKGKILFVLTSHGDLGDTGKGTGFHYEEMTTPYVLLQGAGFDVELASIKGGHPPHDPNSLKEPLEENAASVVDFIKDKEAYAKLENTAIASSLKAKDYRAVYLPGGHGTMWDLPENEALSQLIGDFNQQGKPVAAVCHGIAGFIGATQKNGEPLVKGKRINSFTNAEEQAVNLDKVVPFLLESRLRELGADFESSDNFKPHLAEDGNLITGQNPPSAELVAKAIIGQLS